MPQFTPRTFAEISKSFDEMARDELIKHDALTDFTKFVKASPDRAAQMEFVDYLINYLRTNASVDASKKTLAVMGAMLYVKDQIYATYRWDPLWSANHSLVHARIPSVMGISAKNQLDDQTKAAAEKAFHDLLDDQTLCRDLMRNLTEPMRIPVLKDRVVKNTQLISKVLNDGKLVERSNLADTKKAVQSATLATFDKPLDGRIFGTKNAGVNAKKTCVFTFFGESNDIYELTAEARKRANQLAVKRNAERENFANIQAAASRRRHRR